MSITVQRIALPEQQPQRQDSLTSQIETVKAYFRRETPATDTVATDPVLWNLVATQLGCYDAADYFAKQDSIDYTRIG
jgi:hypothetical protein